MWTLYDIHTNRYWNEEHRCWCTVEDATFYTVQERNQLPLRNLSTQWRFVSAWFHQGEPRPSFAAWR